MSFSEEQAQALSSKLSEKHVKTRNADGRVLSYIEGWYAISEANRIFGYDAWDRETVQTNCVWQGGVGDQKACSYTARVRVTVRAGLAMIVREGSGCGHGIGGTPGEAHERAIKEAETDAMKRALATFGNPFGLALYDKEQRGVRKLAKRSGQSRNETTASWSVVSASGQPVSGRADAVEYCSAIKHLLHQAGSRDEAVNLWNYNRETLNRLREQLPDLQSEKGQHYAEILAELYLSIVEGFSPAERERVTNPLTPADVDGRLSGKTVVPKPVRRRDPDHLKYVASRPCLVCGRTPSEAHHLRHAQPRAMSKKVSDEWTVPVCSIHHRTIHDAGDEVAWWNEKKIDPFQEAARLWGESRSSVGNQKKIRTPADTPRPAGAKKAASGG